MLLNKVALAALFFALIQGTSLAEPASLTCRDDRVHFLTERGVQSFQVEIADDEQERARGLMYRRSLDDGTGMLFIYESPRPVSFWMRNTLIPLDLVFLDAAGLIRHIHPNARPLDESSIPGAAIGDPMPQRLMVLEIGGGEAARLGLGIGQPMAYPRLNQRQAAWRCK